MPVQLDMQSIPWIITAVIFPALLWLARTNLQLQARIADQTVAMTRLEGRLFKAESDIANDKEGRKAVAAMSAQVQVIVVKIEHLSGWMQDVSGRLDGLTRAGLHHTPAHAARDGE